jgi:hypothetical protein
MAWTGSKVFAQWLIGPALQSSGTAYTGIDSDTIKVPLYDDTITPDNNAALASSAYNAGVWTTTEPPQQQDANWPVGGQTLAGKAFTTPAANTVRFDATDLAGAGNVTITAAVGCLVYDDTISGGTVAKQAISYHWFGGAQSVTNGTFTIVWHANGLIQFAL